MQLQKRRTKSVVQNVAMDPMECRELYPCGGEQLSADFRSLNVASIVTWQVS